MMENGNTICPKRQKEVSINLTDFKEKTTLDFYFFTSLLLKRVTMDETRLNCFNFMTPKMEDDQN